LGDEYARYCVSDPIFENFDACTWWLEKTQQINYPNLSKMALDILSIPAMSADPERLFSSTKLVLTDLRNRLGMDLLEAFECLKSWYKPKPWKGDVMWAEG
jgi:hAT family protein